jgi:PPOX class probable F420-dependent enzyme
MEHAMTLECGDLSLLDDPIATELLDSTLPARLAYAWTDGTPRVVPIWFHWDGSAVLMGTPVKAPKVEALRAHPTVAISIDSSTFPYRFLSLRGQAQLSLLDDVSPAYAAAAERYFGPEGGRSWVAQLSGQPMVEIRVVPSWVNIIDFESRLPSALSS